MSSLEVNKKKLYKYRSLTNIEYTLDILLNQRLHCSSYKLLNDPFESLYLKALPKGYFDNNGRFVSFKKTPPRLTSISDFIAHNDGDRVCSLSANATDVRMWAHYADSNRGVAIEVELEVGKDGLFPVEYVDRVSEFGSTILGGARASEVLSKKSYHWKYEEEYRLITNQQFYSVKGQITGVLLGLRTPETLRQTILKLCPEDIPVYSTKLDKETINVVVDQRLGG